MALKGWPDYTRVTGLVENYDEYAQNYPVGMGDGAARMGSIKTYDMRGRVWWMDGFEATVLHWNKTNGGVGGSQALDTAHARNGNQSCRLTTNTGAARASMIWHTFPRPAKENIGLEVSIAASMGFGEIEIWLILYDNVSASAAALLIDEAAETISYRNDTPGWTDTGFDWDHYADPGIFQTFKLVQNYHTDEYKRALYNYQELDLTGEPCHILPAAWPAYMYVRINAIGDDLNNVDCYVDDVILTIMEPP